MRRQDGRTACSWNLKPGVRCLSLMPPTCFRSSSSEPSGPNQAATWRCPVDAYDGELAGALDGRALVLVSGERRKILHQSITVVQNLARALSRPQVTATFRNHSRGLRRTVFYRTSPHHLKDSRVPLNSQAMPIRCLCCDGA
jgi:hypothetical protein